MTIFYLPLQAPISSAGIPRAFAKLYFYKAGTTTDQTIYNNADLAPGHAHAQPVVADATGTFPVIYLDPNAAVDYRVQLKSVLGALIYDQDNYPKSGVSGTTVFSTQFRYDQTAAELAVSVTPTNYFYPPGHVYRYKTNTSPGTTDMTTAFQNAGLVSLNPYAPADTYLITGTTPIIANQNWNLDGAILNITGNTQVFTATTVNDWSIRGRWKIVGDNGAAGATSGTGAGLVISDCMRYHVDKPVMMNIKGWGILIQPGSSTSNRAEKGQIIAPQCIACYIGIEAQAGTGAEYGIIVAPNITRSNTGMKVAAGNIQVIGGSITDNTDGISLQPGTNNLHGTFIGTYINHNTQYDIRHDSGATTNGFDFVGCHIYQNGIYLKQAQGILFKDCTVDVTNYYFEGSQGCGFINCAQPNAYANTINNDFNGSPSYTIWRNCQLLTGKNQGALANYRGLLVGMTSAGITITAANFNAGTTLLLTDAQNSTANHATQTLFDGYNAATGVITCRALGDGHPEFSYLINISNNAADDALMQTSFCYLQKNGAGVEQYFTRTRISTTVTKFTLRHVTNAADGDTFKVILQSSALLANSITVASSETYGIVEGL